MPSPESTKHLIVDLKTGHAYGLKLDGEGKCEAVQMLNTAFESLDGRVVNRFGPTAGVGRLPPGFNPPSTDVSAPPMPYGKTTYAVELKRDGKEGTLFTLVWPKKEEAETGAMPLVAQKKLPDDLVKAGLAGKPVKPQHKGRSLDEAEELADAIANIQRMIGLDNAKRDLEQNIALVEFNQMKIDMGIAAKPISRHMVFAGNPGTGKTTFAREVAKVYHALGFIERPEVLEVTRDKLVAGYVGQTAIKTMEQIEKAKGGVLFIDEAYALSRDSGSGDAGKDFGKEAIDTLVAAMENMRDNLIVIVAGYSEPMKKFIESNEGLKSRFLTYIQFDDYSLPQLGQIMDVQLQDRGYKMTDEAKAYAMKQLEDDKKRSGKDFGNGRTVRNLVEKAEKELALRLKQQGLFKLGHGLSVEDVQSSLTTVTLDDVKKVDLKGLSSKAPEKSIGFAPSRKDFGNDNPRPAQVETAEPVFQPLPDGKAVKKLANQFKP